MPDPTIHSSSWTGPLDDARQPTPGRGAGAPWTPTKVNRARWSKAAAPPTATQRQWARLLICLFLSPLLLLAAWFFVQAASSDILWTDRREWLIFWGLAVAAVFAREVYAGRPVDPLPRSRLLTLVLSATAAFALWYCYAAVTSHSGAMPTIAERTFELYQSPRRHQGQAGYFVHQRANGTTVEGKWVGKAVPYGSTCALVQRLTGDYGFSWIRVLERTPPPEHEIAWPIRREDCFSSKPLASLRR